MQEEETPVAVPADEPTDEAQADDAAQEEADGGDEEASE